MCVCVGVSVFVLLGRVSACVRVRVCVEVYVCAYA